MDFVLAQLVTGLATASALFLTASGLSLIFGVTRVINFAHGALFMLGAFLAESLSRTGLGFWGAALVAPLAVGLVAALFHLAVLRWLEKSAELFPLLATFALVLVLEEAILLIWGPEDRLGPRAPGLEGTTDLLGLPLPVYDLFLVAVGPAVLAVLWLWLRRSRTGLLIRAATQDREMLDALGVDPRPLFTLVFVLGGALAGLAGALQLPREAVHHGLGAQVIVQIFIVVVIGGLGSLPGAYLAAVALALVQAFGIVLFPQASLVLPFLAMLTILALRPRGLMGLPEIGTAVPPEPEARPRTQPPWAAGLALALAMLGIAVPAWMGGFAATLATDIAVLILFAASLQYLTGIGGIVSFGHAAVFGIGAYAAALAGLTGGWPFAATLAAAVLGGAAIGAVSGLGGFRASGVHLAMLTLALAELLHAVAIQWLEVTGGDNGLIGLWPPDRIADPGAYHAFTASLVLAGLLLLRWLSLTPSGGKLRGLRDAPSRAAALGLRQGLARVEAFAWAGAMAGLAGGLYAYAKGGVFPNVLSVDTTLDALIAVTLGGLLSLFGAVAGAIALGAGEALIAAETDRWRLILGLVLLLTVVLLPRGLAGIARGIRR